MTFDHPGDSGDHARARRRPHDLTGQEFDTGEDAATTPGGAGLVNGGLANRDPVHGGLVNGGRANGTLVSAVRPVATIVQGGDGSGRFVGPPEDPERLALDGVGLLGGEGVTWQARYAGHLGSPLVLAVKQLNRPPGAGRDWPSPAERQRWQDQRVLLQSIRAPHVVPVVDVFLGPPPHAAGEADASLVPYVVMPWIPGPSLAQHLGGAPATARTLSERLGWVHDLAEALASIHSAANTQGNPLVHRDVKPPNCILDPRHGLTLVDLGTLRPVTAGIDATGMHTPRYAGPEVVRDPHAPRRPASEVYSLGAVALFCLTGQEPPSSWEGDYLQVARQRALDAAAVAGVPDPAAFADHLVLALSPEPDCRPRSVMSWAVDLQRLATGASVAASAPLTGRRRARKRVVGALGAAGIVLVAAASMFAVTHRTGFGDEMRGPAGSPRTSTTPTPTSSARTSTAPMTSGSSTRAAAASTVTTSAPTMGATPVTAPAAAHATASIERPAGGGRVGQCETVRGRAHLPAGVTLVTAVRNLDNKDPMYYLQPVEGWRQPQALATWSSVQFFGSGDDSVGQNYVLAVFAADLASVRESHDRAAQATWVFAHAPKGWTQVASVQPLHRVAGGTC